VAWRDRRPRRSGDQVGTASPAGTPCRRVPDVAARHRMPGRLCRRAANPGPDGPATTRPGPGVGPSGSRADRRPTSFIRCGWARPRVARRPWSARATGRT